MEARQAEVNPAVGGSGWPGSFAQPTFEAFGLDRTSATLVHKWYQYLETRASQEAVRFAEQTVELLKVLTTPKLADVDPRFWLQLEHPPRSDVSVSSDGSTSTEDSVQPPRAKLPKSAVKYAQGLLFLFQSKVGILTSLAWGTGFLLNKIGEEDGKVTWSAPSFVTLHHLSVGLTFGFCHRGTCIALTNHDMVELMLYGQPVLGLDVNIIMDYLHAAYEGAVSSARITSSQVWFDKRTLMPRYEALDGSMVDVSCKVGAVKVNNDIHRRLYGRHTTPHEILFGQVPPLEEFKVLYECLQKLAQESEI